VLLPMVNALLDWLSWIVTRFFLRRVAQVTPTWRGAVMLVLELGADLAAALVLFLALVVLLPNGIEIINAILSLAGRAEFDWRDIVVRANEAPLSEGLFVLGMLVTTLVPTFVHITRGLASIAAAWTPGAAEAAAGLRAGTETAAWPQDEAMSTSDAGVYYYQETAPYGQGPAYAPAGFQDAAVVDYAAPEDEASDAPLRPSVQQKAARALRLSRLWYLPAAVAALGVFVGLVAIIDAAGVSLGDVLVQLAFCASSWSHGQCPA